MPTVVGLDLSLSCTGFARLSPGGTLVTESIQTHSNWDTTFRTITIATRLHAVIQPDDIVFLENYAFSAVTSNLTALAELGGLVKAVLYRRDQVPFLVATVQMRKFIAGDAKLKKDMIPRAVLQAFGDAPATHDECVAAVLARFGMMVVDPECGTVNCPQYRLELVQKYREKHQASLQALANNS